MILCRTGEAAQAALDLVRHWVLEYGLALHPDKTRLVDIREEGFDFPGYHFASTRSGIRHRAGDKSFRKLKDHLRKKTKRTNGRSLEFVIADVNRTLRGWFAYFRHSRPWVFAPLDRFVRQRLRALLKKRQKRRGCARGRDCHRWKNAFFAERGLLSLKTAHATACQSSLR